MLLLKAGTFLDGTGAPALKNATLLVDGDTIKAINPAEVPADCEVLDYSGKTIMPGMINAHIHVEMRPDEDATTYYARATDVELTIRSMKHLQDHLRSGVTYVRSLGSKHNVDIQLRDLANSGAFLSPGIVASGENISMTGGHGWYIGMQADGEDGCRRATRLACRNTCDVVKFMATGGVLTRGMEAGAPQFTKDEIRVIVEEAHKAGRKTTSHAQGATGIQYCLDAGCDCIEHGIYLSDAMIEQMLKQGTYLVPTLEAPWAIIEYAEVGKIPEFAVRKSKIVKDDHFDSFRRAYKAGVKIALGTDAGTPFNFHYSTWYELKLMQDAAGIPGAELVVMATSAAAELLDISGQYGSLVAGKKADILVLDESPLDNVEAFSKVHAVFKHGVKVPMDT